MKIDKSRRIMFFVSLIGIVVVTLIMGTTFAYQTLVVDYKEGSDNDTIVEAGKLNVSYENDKKIDLKNMTLLPDYKTADYTEFTIKTNDTSYDVAYQINLNNLVYTDSMISENFKYTITLVENDEEFIIGAGDFSSLSGTEINLPFNMNTYRILGKGKNETLRLYLWLQENENSQSFEKGSFKGTIELVSLFSNEITDTIYKTFKVNAINSKLPDEYQEVEYIQTSGTQYLIIDYIASGITNSKGKFQITDKSKANFLFGSRGASGQLFYGLNWGGALPYKFYNSYSAGTLTNKDIDEEIHTFSKEKGKLYIDNNLVNTASDATFTTPANMEIFACYNNGVEGYLPTYAKLFYLEFYDEDVLKVDLVPCYRKSDNVIGMYDLVTNKFYQNRGTGQFDKGTNITEGHVGEYDEATNKYKIIITIKTDNVVHSTYEILLNEPLRKYNNAYDYIDLINGRIVRNIKVIDNVYSVLEDPIYEELEKYNIPYIQNSTISICDSNNICTNNIEIETNK